MNNYLKPSALAIIGLIAAAPMIGIGLNSHSTPLRYVAIQSAHAQDAAPAAPEQTPEQLSGAAYTVLEKTCSGCHGEGKRLNKVVATDRASYERLVNEQKMVVPGKPDESELYERMIDHEHPMPPKKAEPKPTTEEIEAVRLWIEKGAPTPVPAAAPATPAAPTAPAKG